VAHHTDLAELIAADHRKVEELFGQLEREDGDRRRLVDQVIDELTAHAAAEEQVVYPAIRDMVSGGGQMADHALSEHKSMKQAMTALEQGQPGDSQFETALRNLMSEVRDHVPEEENELLPALRMVIGADKMIELGDVFNQVKGTISTHSSA
jgi:hemerythrin superfamily protein